MALQGEVTSQVADRRSPERVGPLADVRVLDCSGEIGAYCSKLLADYGADVIKVEPPGGDPLRRRGPFRDGTAGVEASLSFAYYHANKRGVTTDVTRSEANDLLSLLAGSSDVIIVSPTPRQPVHGFDDDEQRLGWAPDGAVVCSITPFGVTGPYRRLRATHLVAYAMSGAMHPVGPAGGPPREIAGQIHWDLASLHAAFTILAALRIRADVGAQFLDISAHEVQASHDYFFERWSVAGGRLDPRSAGFAIPPTGTWQCADGLFDVAAYQPRHWDAFLEMLDHPQELEAPALADAALRRELHDGLRDVMADLIAGRSRTELFERGQLVGLPTGLLNTPADFVKDVQLEERGSLVNLPERPVTGSFRAPAPAPRTEPALTQVTRPAPTLGEHNAEIFLGELGVDQATFEHLRELHVV